MASIDIPERNLMLRNLRNRKRKLNDGKRYKLNNMQTLEKKRLSDYKKNYGALTKAAANNIMSRTKESNRQNLPKKLNKPNNFGRMVSNAARNKKEDDLKVIMERWNYENSTKKPLGGFSSYSGSITADTKGNVRKNPGMTAAESRARNTFRVKHI
jgi:hypothetical protein